MMKRLLVILCTLASFLACNKTEVQLSNTPFTLVGIKDGDVYDGQWGCAEKIGVDGAEANTLKWTSSDPAVATVSKDGVISPQKSGSTTITVSNAVCEHFFYFRVKMPRIDDLTLSKSTIYVKPGGKAYVDIKNPEGCSASWLVWFLDDAAEKYFSIEYSKEIDGRVWIKSSSSAPLDYSGILYAGTHKTSGEYYQVSAKIRTASNPVASIKLSPETVNNFKVGWFDKPLSVKLIGKDPSFDCTDTDLEWHYDKSILNINPDTGEIEALKAGSAQVYVTCGSVKSNIVTFNVVEEMVTSIVISHNEDEFLIKGQTKTYTAQAYNGSQKVSAHFTWSISDPSVASVDSKGVVTGKGSGDAVLKVASQGVEKAIGLMCFDPSTFTPVVYDNKGYEVNSEKETFPQYENRYYVGLGQIGSYDFREEKRAALLLEQADMHIVVSGVDTKHASIGVGMPNYFIFTGISNSYSAPIKVSFSSKSSKTKSFTINSYIDGVSLASSNHSKAMDNATWSSSKSTTSVYVWHNYDYIEVKKGTPFLLVHDGTTYGSHTDGYSIYFDKKGSSEYADQYYVVDADTKKIIYAKIKVYKTN